MLLIEKLFMRVLFQNQLEKNNMVTRDKIRPSQ